MGIVSCLGNTYSSVIDSVREGRSGIRPMPDWATCGIASQVAGQILLPNEKIAALRLKRSSFVSMSEAGLYCLVAASDAVSDAGLQKQDLAGHPIAVIVGSGTGSVVSVYEAAKLACSGQASRIDPFNVLRCMSSSTSAAVANALGTLGPSYSISAACATSTHNIGHGFNLVRSGAAKIAICGGGEAVNELMAASFHAMRFALSTKFNKNPHRASRPFDRDRDGFVLSGGSGVLVLENLDSAIARGAKPRVEVLGYGATTDGYDPIMPDPSGTQAAQCMVQALADASIRRQEVDYINAHATSTRIGDVAEARAITKVFRNEPPPLSSTKSITGHAIGASGAHEVIFSVGMLELGFLAPSINLDNRDPEFEKLQIINAVNNFAPSVVLTNSFGFGGTNASLILASLDR